MANDLAIHNEGRHNAHTYHRSRGAFHDPSLIRRIDPRAIAKRGFPPGFATVLERQSADVGAQRITEMDEAGISMHVLSLTGPGADLIEGEDGIALARDINNELAKAVAANPARFAGFAHLPMADPLAAADELERSVREHGFCGALINGLTGDPFLDDARFEPILHRAEQLDVPLYIHPNLPPASVANAYYEGLPGTRVCTFNCRLGLALRSCDPCITSRLIRKL